eukprot:CAMPEP_0171923584 /NCGR_PEP_ID=MMETSP0993-20121228/22267_1 /TAXON_ID=483369 /ORGANISM="non described non described, Strain CCMP2098" /LENGTH=179 /DNA_ID=CAMNT_0012561635 /DNA_START=43 /DNA_END=582 /DNA_ORIENTATION=+
MTSCATFCSFNPRFSPATAFTLREKRDARCLVLEVWGVDAHSLTFFHFFSQLSLVAPPPPPAVAPRGHAHLQPLKLSRFGSVAVTTIASVAAAVAVLTVVGCRGDQDGAVGVHEEVRQEAGFEHGVVVEAVVPWKVQLPFRVPAHDHAHRLCHGGLPERVFVQACVPREKVHAFAADGP